MRTYWPMEDYRLLKNRKSARICRQRRKGQIENIQTTLKNIKDENEQLRLRIKYLERMSFKKEQNATQDAST